LQHDRKIFVKTASFVTTLLAASALASPASAQTPPKPKLIVAISVDQLSTDLFNEYRSTFTGGLKRLSSGIVFPRGHQSHAATETCPGHSPMTGKTQNLNARTEKASRRLKSIARKSPEQSAAMLPIRRFRLIFCVPQHLVTG
jgi:hypothetical protein